jgi:hypothetical protein
MQPDFDPIAVLGEEGALLVPRDELTPAQQEALSQLSEAEVEEIIVTVRTIEGISARHGFSPTALASLKHV